MSRIMARALTLAVISAAAQQVRVRLCVLYCEAAVVVLDIDMFFNLLRRLYSPADCIYGTVERAHVSTEDLDEIFAATQMLASSSP